MNVIVTVWIISFWVFVLTSYTNIMQHRLRHKRHLLYAKRRSRYELDRDRRVPKWVHVRIAKIERQYEKRLNVMSGTLKSGMLKKGT